MTLRTCFLSTYTSSLLPVPDSLPGPFLRSGAFPATSRNSCAHLRGNTDVFPICLLTKGGEDVLPADGGLSSLTAGSCHSLRGGQVFPGANTASLRSYQAPVLGRAGPCWPQHTASLRTVRNCVSLRPRLWDWVALAELTFTPPPPMPAPCCLQLPPTRPGGCRGRGRRCQSQRGCRVPRFSILSCPGTQIPSRPDFSGPFSSSP